MPEFMAAWPEGNDYGGPNWNWESTNEDIGVANFRTNTPRKNLKPSNALKMAVKSRFPYGIDMEPNFQKIDGRYISLNKENNKWEVIIADETESHRFQIEIFSIYSRGIKPAPPLQVSKAEEILEAIKSGRYVNKKEYLDLMGDRPPKEEWLVVELRRDGVLLFEGKEVSLRQFTVISRDSVDSNPKSRLHLRADKKCKTEDIRSVVKAASDGGLKNVIFGAFITE